MWIGDYSRHDRLNAKYFEISSTVSKQAHPKLNVNQPPEVTRICSIQSAWYNQRVGKFLCNKRDVLLKPAGDYSAYKKHNGMRKKK